MSSSKDEILKDMYDNIIKGGNKNDIDHGDINEILNWFKSLNILETLKVSESDVEEAFKSVSENMATINSEQFLNFLNQLSKTANIEITMLQEKLLEPLEYENLEKQIKNKLAEAKDRLEDINEWINKNDIVNKADAMESEVAEVLNKVKDQATIGLNDLSQATEKLAEQVKGNWSNLLKRITDQGPSASTTEKQEKKTD